MSDITEDRNYIENYNELSSDEKLCANFINCGKITGGAVWFLGGAHYCEECGQKTYAAFEDYEIKVLPYLDCLKAKVRKVY